MALDTIPKQEGGKLKAVASGTLPNGKPVVVNADGTVGVISETVVSEASGTPSVYEASESNYNSVTYDANSNKIVVAYSDIANSSYGTAVVGTVSGGAISFGSPVVFRSAATSYTSCTYDENSQKVVIAASESSSNRGIAFVGTVSGTSISFGSLGVFNNAQTLYVSCAYEPIAQKIVVSYRDGGNSDYGTAAVGTVSGTSISFGSEVVFASVPVYDYTSVVYDASAEKIVIAYPWNSQRYGTATVGTVSGTSISFGSSSFFEVASCTYVSAAYDANAKKVVVCYNDGGNSGRGTAAVGTVSGTSISFGSPVVFGAQSNSYISTTYHAAAQKIVTAYGGGGDGFYVTGTVSGTSISFGTPVMFLDNTDTSMFFGTTYDAGEKESVIVYRDRQANKSGTAFTYHPAYNETNLTSENYIGISTGGAVADGNSATVDIVGTVSTNQTGLTAGQQYYVQTDGTVGTTPADPSVLAGTAISATKMLVKT
jgi:hypothetical protein